MIVADLLKNGTRTIGDLATDEMRKSLSGDDSDDRIQRLTQMHDHVVALLKEAFNAEVDIKSLTTSMMSSAAKAANAIAGKNAEAETERLRSQKFELAKAIAAAGRRATTAAIRATVVDTSSQLVKMREHAAAINSGQLKVDERTRRMLLDRLGKAEMALAKVAL